MKKIISILVGSLFFASSALAVSGMVGVKVGNGDLEATKQAITNTPSALTEAAETNSIDHTFAAIFAEVNVNDSPINVGLELVPLTGTISVTNGNDTDASIEVSNLKTIYASASRPLDNGGTVYAKIGYSHADLDNAKQSNGTTTINSFSESLEGPMVGVGFQAPENDQGIIFRAEATIAKFDDVQVKTTDTDGLAETKKGTDIEFTTFTISLAKAF